MARQIGSIRVNPRFSRRHRYLIDGGWWLILTALAATAWYLTGSEFPMYVTMLCATCSGLVLYTAVWVWYETVDAIYSSLERLGFTEVQLLTSDEFVASLGEKEIIGELVHANDGNVAVFVRLT